MPALDPTLICRPNAYDRLDEALAAAVARLSVEYAARRDVEIAVSVLDAVLPARRFWIYGAGTHTATLIERMRAPERVAGIVDAFPGERHSFCGFDILSVADFARRTDEIVFVAHPAREGEMVDTLLASGIARHNIVTLYQSAAYVRAVPPPRDLPAGPVPAAIVGDTRYIVIADAVLAEVLDPATTPYFAFEWHAQPKPDGPFRKIDLGKSLDHLAAALRACRPRLVYVRGFIQTAFLAYFVRQILPDCVLVHELWDFTVLLEDDQLADMLLLRPETIETARLTDLWSVQHSDMAISKRGGRAWDRYGLDGTPPARIYFSGVTAEAPPPPRPHAGLPRLAYAGILPAFAELPRAKYDYTFLPLMQEAVAAGLAGIGIFNSLHLASAPIGFEIYEAWFGERGIAYSPRVDYATLMAELAGYDYGWLAVAPRDDWDPDKPVIAPARLTGYVNAGLPLLVNEPFSYCVDLVREFDAGLVLEEYSVEGLRDALRQADPARHRAGVQRLKAHLLAENDKLLADLAALRQGGKPNLS